MKVNAFPSSTETVYGTPVNAGTVLTSRTVRVIPASVLATPSLTRTVNGYVPGPCDSAGFQVKTPLVEPIEAPSGAPTSENASP